MYFAEVPMSVNVSINATGCTWVALDLLFLENISSNVKRLEVTKVSVNGTGSIVPVDLKTLINITLLDAYDFTIMVVSDVNGIIGRSLPSYHVKIGK
jgi:hypothetical protein